ncbi:MAG: cation transporting ATPase C-terminal domain-containing protein [Candidatus Xenobiia bacterium LiM19]
MPGCLGQNHSAFHGLFENKSFLLIVTAIIIGQILFVQFGGAMFRTVPLSLNEWLIISIGNVVCTLDWRNSKAPPQITGFPESCITVSEKGNLTAAVVTI